MMLGKIKGWVQQKLKRSKPLNGNKEAKQEQLKNAIAVIILLATAYGFYLYSSKESELKKESNAAAVFDGAFDKNFNKNSDEALIEKQQQQIDELKELMQKRDNQPVKEVVAPESSATQAALKSLKEKMQLLESENKAINEKLQVALVKNTQVRVEPTSLQRVKETERGRLKRLQMEREFYAKAGLETVHFKHRAKGFEEERTPNNYVWAGTFAEGILLSGAKGDAGVNGSKNMGTALIRLDSNGIMPNNKRSHLNGCFALVSTYGDLSEDAVVMHLETLSCAGRFSFEQKVYGSVFDLDAMEDLRGTSILKTKPLLNYTAAAGLLAGLGDGLKNYGSAQSINTQTGAITTYSTAMNLAQSAAGSALSNPANKISDYIMKIADIYHPLVVARAGRRVSVMFSQGFWIDKAHQKYESNKAMDRRDGRNEATVATELSSAGASTPSYQEGFAQKEESKEGYSLPTSGGEEVAAQFLEQNGLGQQPLYSPVKPVEGANHD